MLAGAADGTAAGNMSTATARSGAVEMGTGGADVGAAATGVGATATGTVRRMRGGAYPTPLAPLERDDEHTEAVERAEHTRAGIVRATAEVRMRMSGVRPPASAMHA